MPDLCQTCARPDACPIPPSARTPLSQRLDPTQDGAGRSRGFGTVLFSSTRDAAKAIQIFNESEFNGRTIEVRPDQYS